MTSIRVRWICRALALTSFLWIAGIALLATPDALVFAFKRGMLLVPGLLFIASLGGWVVSSYYARATYRD